MRFFCEYLFGRRVLLLHHIYLLMPALIPKRNHVDKENYIDEQSNKLIDADLEDDLGNVVLGPKVKKQGDTESTC